jgi:hypothetical protein
MNQASDLLRSQESGDHARASHFPAPNYWTGRMDCTSNEP